MKTKSELWFEYSRMAPVAFGLYDGYCQCELCERYRKEANEWIDAQIAQQQPSPVDDATGAGERLTVPGWYGMTWEFNPYQSCDPITPPRTSNLRHPQPTTRKEIIRDE